MVRFYCLGMQLEKEPPQRHIIRARTPAQATPRTGAHFPHPSLSQKNGEYRRTRHINKAVYKSMPDGFKWDYRSIGLKFKEIRVLLKK